ncbi:hypothetical protein HK104_002251 [Borealophlyctis nickersoniae]|nr:hypothetical protein HK104_002251 [Borealophlyctis nickersoniae]
MKFLSAVGVVLGTAIVIASAQLPGFDDYARCAKVDVRKEQHDLTADEWTHWMNGIRGAASDYTTSYIDLTKLDADLLASYQNATATKPFSVWEQIAWIHQKYYTSIHGGPIFHVWHRHLLRDVETFIQKHYEPEFKFHYWATHMQYNPPDWCLDPSWKYIGQANDAKDITDGPLGNITFTLTNRGLYRGYRLWSTGCWRSGFMGGGVFIHTNSWATQAQYDAAYTDTKETGYSDWAVTTESVHFMLHNSQGGAQIRGAASPLDDLFWLHHSNVDLQWHAVQTRWNADGKNQSFQLNLPTSTVLPYYNVPVSDAQFIAQQCVKYAPVVNGPPKQRDVTHFCPAIQDEFKLDCGNPGITAQQCQAKGCCWVPGQPGSKTPWCFTNPATGALNEPIVIPQTSSSLMTAECAKPVPAAPIRVPADMFVMAWGSRAGEVKERFDKWAASVADRMNAGGVGIERLEVAGVQRPTPCVGAGAA